MKAIPPPLLQPNAEEAARAAEVGALIEAEIEAHAGCLAFDRYMELALYAPSVGYYNGGVVKLGAQGDYITAPELGSLFGRCVARRCADVLANAGDGSILEFGAGSGALCRQVMEYLATAGCLPRQYLILETSPDLRARQQQTVARLPQPLAERVAWLEGLPDAPFQGVAIANEVLDAMPVTRFRVTGQGHEIIGVGASPGGFHWCGAGDSHLRAGIDSLIARHRLLPGYVSEYHSRATAWVRRIPDWLAQGVVLLIDYGYPAAEYYHPQRASGTLKCFFHHVSHDDPLVLPGVQDITAHLDFSALAEAGVEAGLDVLGYTSQAAFLMESGLALDLATPAPSPESQMALANEVKRLTLPGEMGEIFKVMAVGRNVDTSRVGFGRADRRYTLDAPAGRN